MFDLFKKKNKGKKLTEPSSLDSDHERDVKRYEEEKRIAQSDNKKLRLSLADDSRTHKEILYYLAEHDPDPAIRRAVAVNISTPIQATTLLSKDSDEDVRMAIAGRLVELLPDLTEERHSKLYAFAVQALGDLALDEVLKIRKALSSALKDHAHTPPKIAGELARDIEREVSEPILRFCSALADKDMLDILKGCPDSWVVQAIAEREEVNEPVAKAVIDTGDKPAGESLISNEGAKITTNLLLTIIEKSKEYPEWQNSLAARKALPPAMAQKLAEFADESVRNILLKRKDFDKDTIDEIATVVKRRVTFASEGEQQETKVPEKECIKVTLARAKKMLKDGTLNEETISDAIAMRDRQFIYAAFACLVHSNIDTIAKIFEMQAPKPLVSLCWKAKLSMRLALQVQQEVGHIPHNELLYPKGGTDYPLPADDMIWQLEFLGIEARE